MECCTCHTAVALARKGAIADVTDVAPAIPPFRMCFVCQERYTQLDTTDGVGQVGGRLYCLADPFRFAGAQLYNQQMYDAYLQSEALKLTGVPS
jgi:hypothetical protein